MQMASSAEGSFSVTPTQGNISRQERSKSNQETSFRDKDGFLPPPKAEQDNASSSSTAGGLVSRMPNFTVAGTLPGSFSADLKSVGLPRSAVSRPGLPVPLGRDDIWESDELLSEKRQAEFRDRIKKETKIKVGSENLLEALASKNAKQTKDQRLRVESELSSSNRKIANLKSQLADEIQRAKRPSTPDRSRFSGLLLGSPIRSPSRNQDGYFQSDSQDVDLEIESPTYVLAEILQALELEGKTPDYYVARANSLVELFKRHPNLKYDLAWSVFGLRIQTMLLSESREVVAAGYRLTRYAIADRKSLQTIRRLHTDDLVVLSLIKESKASIEREQALKFVRAFLEVKDGVWELSDGVIRTVVSVAEHHEDRLRSMSLLTLTEILIKSPSQAVNAGAVTPLMDAVTEGNYKGCDSLVSALLHMLDMPQHRKLLRQGSGLEGTLAVFTDPLTLHGHEERLTANIRSITAMLTSWAGIFTLSKNKFVGVKSLLLSFYYPIPFARELLLDLLFNVLHIKPPSWTSSFLAGRRLTTYGRVSTLKAMPSAYPSKFSEDDESQHNLVQHYTSLILAILISCGLLKTLEDLIEDSIDSTLRRKAILFLSELLKLANYSLPSKYSAELQVMPSLLRKAVDGETDEQYLAVGTIYQVDSVNRTLHRFGVSSKAPMPPSVGAREFSSLSIFTETGSSRLSIDMDELQFRSLLLETQVLSTINYLKWKWNLINDLITGPLLNPKRLSDAISATKFLKRLIGFFRPFNYRFSQVKNTKPNQRYVRTGCALFKSLLQNAEGIRFLAESKLLRQLAECLAQVDRASGLTSESPLFSPHRTSETLTGGYFALLGTLSSDPRGLSMIERWRMINMFYHIIELQNRGDLVKLLLSNIDFSLDSHLRIMLTKALTDCPKHVRIISTKLLRQYAARSPQANDPSNDPEWAIRSLVTQLYDPEVEVCEVAVQILEESCNYRQCLEYVVRCRPALDHLGEIGAPLLLRFLSTSLGYQYLDGLDYITQEMDDWFLGRNESYVNLVEASLSRALSEQPERPQSSYEENFWRQKCGLVPPHFYRELTRTLEGCKLLKRSGHFDEFAYTIREYWHEREDRDLLRKVKGCLWAVGNIGSMELGAPFLEETDVVRWIALIAERSEIITMRGTAFFVLGLISRSIHGLEIIAEHDWEVGADPWGRSPGYCLPRDLDKLFSIDLRRHDSKNLVQRTAITKIEAAATDVDPLITRILRLIIELGNPVLTKRAAMDLHTIKSKSPGKFAQRPLFRKAMSILEGHPFRLPVRSFVIDLFEKSVMRHTVLEDESDEEP